jgi:hypothetical protein
MDIEYDGGGQVDKQRDENVWAGLIMFCTVCVCLTAIICAWLLR